MARDPPRHAGCRRRHRCRRGGALETTRLLSGLLYGITPTDPSTYIGVVALLLVVASVASWLPAQRAARVDPVISLRDE